MDPAAAIAIDRGHRCRHHRLSAVEQRVDLVVTQPQPRHPATHAAAGARGDAEIDSVIEVVEIPVDAARITDEAVANPQIERRETADECPVDQVIAVESRILRAGDIRQHRRTGTKDQFPLIGGGDTQRDPLHQRWLAGGQAEVGMADLGNQCRRLLRVGDVEHHIGRAQGAVIAVVGGPQTIVCGVDGDGAATQTHSDHQNGAPTARMGGIVREDPDVIALR